MRLSTRCVLGQHQRAPPRTGAPAGQGGSATKPPTKRRINSKADLASASVIVSGGAMRITFFASGPRSECPRPRGRRRDSMPSTMAFAHSAAVFSHNRAFRGPRPCRLSRHANSLQMENPSTSANPPRSMRTIFSLLPERRRRQIRQGLPKRKRSRADSRAPGVGTFAIIERTEQIGTTGRRRDRHAVAESLAQNDDVRLDAVRLEGEHVPVRPKFACTSSRMKTMSFSRQKACSICKYCIGRMVRAAAANVRFGDESAQTARPN